MTQTVDEPIIEGCICPICKLAFSTVEVLHVHYNTEHETFDVIPCPETTTSSIFASSLSTATVSHAFFDRVDVAQPLGHFRSRTGDLKMLRLSRRNRNAMQVNTLLIRLEKLLNIPPLAKPERRELEQSIVPWVDAKVDLCPSCGKPFGLGVEEVYPSTEQANNVTIHDRLITRRKMSFPELSKRKLSQLANAVLDYNPVFRRRHHCRLCGYLVCADCCHFLPRSNAIHLLKTIDEHNLHRSFGTHLAVAEADQPPIVTEEPLFLHESSCHLPLIDVERGPTTASFWRVCGVCKQVLEKRLHRLKNRHRVSPIVSIYKELKMQMDKVTESAPLYANIAKSLNSGEQRYTLEVAQTMRHELLESLQQIDCLKKQIEVALTRNTNLRDTAQGSSASIRVAGAISNMVRQFIQHNLPPIRVLPTLQQYHSLTAQRQKELTARWTAEDRAIADLEMRVAMLETNSSQNKRSIGKFTKTQEREAVKSKEVTVEDLNRLAVSIDDVSRRLIQAQRAGDRNRTNSLCVELDCLERQFRSMSCQIQSLQKC